jgi:WD40 repeat protein
MRQARYTWMPSFQTFCVFLGWLGVCLLLSACAATQDPTSTAPRATTAPGALGGAYHGHSSVVYAVAWSPDGTRIASGGNDSTVQELPDSIDRRVCGWNVGYQLVTR